MKRILLLLGILGFALSAGASGFIEKLSEDKMRAAGLDKLTAQERAELERLVAEHYGAREPKAAAPTAEAPQPATDKRPSWISALITLKEVENTEKPEPVTAKLVGDYKGWSGRTTFRLDNGQVWQQTDGTQRADDVRTAPGVKIYPGIAGVYWLEVEGIRQRVKVKPVRLQ